MRQAVSCFRKMIPHRVLRVSHMEALFQLSLEADSHQSVPLGAEVMCRAQDIPTSSEVVACCLPHAPLRLWHHLPW